jgi:hypothetical protein
LAEHRAELIAEAKIMLAENLHLTLSTLRQFVESWPQKPKETSPRPTFGSGAAVTAMVGSKIPLFLTCVFCITTTKG